VARVLSGEIRWADLDPTRGHEQSGRRPVLILSNDTFNERSQTVIAMVVTSQPQRTVLPLSYELRAMDLPKRSWIKITQVRTLAVERLGDALRRVSEEQLLDIVEGLNEVIGR
jgi:mRNA interferase MazF